MALYKAERDLFSERPREDPEGMPRQALAHTRVLRGRPHSLERRIAATRAFRVPEGGSSIAVRWVDNFNRHKWQKHYYGASTRGLDATVSAVVLIPRPTVPFPRQLTLVELYDRYPTLASNLGQHCIRFSEEIRTFLAEPPLYKSTRVPCDSVRGNVSSAKWCPDEMWDQNVGCTSGLFTVLQKVVYDSYTPLLMDVNPFYRIYKSIYGIQVGDPNVLPVVDKLPLLFGLWHGYEQCLRRLKMNFRSYICFLEKSEVSILGIDAQVPNMFSVRNTEALVVALCILAPQLEAALNDCCLHCLRVWGSNSPQYIIACNLRLLVTQYAPAAFCLGRHLRDCYWGFREANTGLVAKACAMSMLTFLTFVDMAKPSLYTRGLSLALLSWSPFHSHLPAFVFVEECLEATISRLSKAYPFPVTAATFQRVRQCWRALGPPRSGSGKLPHGGYPETYVYRVKIRLQTLLTATREGRCLYIAPPREGEPFVAPSLHII